MAEILTLTTPETFPSVTTWRVANVYLDQDAPAIKATLIANTGEAFVYRYVPSETVTVAQVLNALSYVNQGKFKSINNESLQHWLLDQIATQLANKVGTVSGTPS